MENVQEKKIQSGFKFAFVIFVFFISIVTTALLMKSSTTRELNKSLEDSVKLRDSILKYQSNNLLIDIKLKEDSLTIAQLKKNNRQQEKIIQQIINEANEKNINIVNLSNSATDSLFARNKQESYRRFGYLLNK
jgi:hypothetical protein